MGNSMEDFSKAYQNQIESAQKVKEGKRNKYLKWLKELKENAEKIQKEYRKEEGLEK